MNYAEYDQKLAYARRSFSRYFDKLEKDTYEGDDDIRVYIEEIPKYFLIEIQVYSEHLQQNGSRTKGYHCKLQLRYDGRRHPVTFVVIGSKGGNNTKLEELQKKMDYQNNGLNTFSGSHAQKIIRLIATAFGKRVVVDKKQKVL